MLNYRLRKSAGTITKTIGWPEKLSKQTTFVAKLFPDFQFVSQAATKLSWSHFIEILSLNE